MFSNGPKILNEFLEHHDDSTIRNEVNEATLLTCAAAYNCFKSIQVLLESQVSIDVKC